MAVELMTEAGKPMSVNEIAEGLVEKKGVVESDGLGNNIRTMLYGNRKGFFEKVEKGLFGLGEK